MARTTYRWDVQTLDTLSTKWLPAPYPVTSLDAPGDWRYDRDTLDFYSAADGQAAGGVSYDLERLARDALAEAHGDLLATRSLLAESVRDIVAPGMRLAFDPTKPDGMPRKLLDVSRLGQRGWRARTALPEGIARAYAAAPFAAAAASRPELPVQP